MTEVDFPMDKAFCYNCKNYDKDDKYCSERKEVQREPIHCCYFTPDLTIEESLKTLNIYPNKEIKELKDELLIIFMQQYPDLNKANELIARMFMKHNKVYAIRDDKSDELWVYNEGIFVPDGMTYINEFCRAILGKRSTSTIANKVIFKIKTDNYINKEEFFKVYDPHEVVVKNGILNLRTGYLSKFTSDRIFLNKLDITYNPDKKIKYIMNFMQEILDVRDVFVIQELFGYCLVKEYKIQKAFMFLGSGSNGKSAMLNLLKTFVGDKNCSSVTLSDLQENIYSASELFGKMVNIAGDVNNRVLEDTSVFKAVTGGDRIGASRKFLTPIYFENNAKWINACNELPRPKDLSEGFWRRWILLRFNQKFMPKNEYDKLSVDKQKKVKVADENIIQAIISADELSGLLNWAIEGLNRLLDKKHFSYDKDSNEVRSDWVRLSSSFNAFLMDYVEEGDEEDFITKDKLRNEYTMYCRKFKVKPEGDKVIHNLLTNVAGAWDSEKRVDEHYQNVWRGIRFKQELGLDNILAHVRGENI